MNKHHETFIKNMLEICEEQTDIEKAKKEFIYYGQIKPMKPVPSPIYDNPNKTIKWGILFYNEKTNKPLICSSKSQYYLRKKTREFNGVKQTRKGDGSSKKPINKSMLEKLQKPYITAIQKIERNEEITPYDIKQIIKSKNILENIQFDYYYEAFTILYKNIISFLNNYNY